MGIDLIFIGGLLLGNVLICAGMYELKHKMYGYKELPDWKTVCFYMGLLAINLIIIGGWFVKKGW